jgi:hypothetical protein
MSEQIKFLIFCIEIYRSAKNISGKAAIKLFKKFGIYGYILNSYPALHTFGTKYLIKEFDEIIKSGGIRR